MNKRFIHLIMLLPMLGTSAASGVQTIAETLPEGWEANRQYTPTMPADDAWWQGFGDPVLTELIERAEARNYDLQAAIHRLEAARRQIGEARSAYFPQLGVNAGWTASSKQQTANSEYFSIGATASWEIDVFGRVNQQVKSAKSAAEVSRADRASVMQSLCAEVATEYFQLRTLQAQYRIARAHIASQDTVTQIAQARHEAGLASMLDVAQARVVLYSTQAAVPGLESTIRATISSIATLVGCYYEDIATQLEAEAPLPDCYRLVAVGVPADLLRRRPDVRQAEAQIEAQAAALGIAKKDYLPTLSITGSIGTSAHNAGDLFGKQSLTWAVAPQLSWTIFDGLARRERVAAAGEQMQAAIDNYNSTLLAAVNETNTAMSTYASALQTIGLDKNVVEESERSLSLALEEYTQGLIAFTDVANAQMSVLQYQNSLVSAQGKALQALVALYKALGGAPE